MARRRGPGRLHQKAAQSHYAPKLAWYAARLAAGDFARVRYLVAAAGIVAALQGLTARMPLAAAHRIKVEPLPGGVSPYAAA